MAESEKQEWEAPTLTVLGDLETLTSAGGTPVPDGVGTLGSA